MLLSLVKRNHIYRGIKLMLLSLVKRNHIYRGIKLMLLSLVKGIIYTGVSN